MLTLGHKAYKSESLHGVIYHALLVIYTPLVRLWGTLLADIVIQMLGTDYARIVQAVYAFAQVKFMLFSSVF